MRLVLSLSLTALLLSATMAQAADLGGTWQRADGRSRVAFAPCPGGVCGKLVWSKPDVKSKAHIGDTVFHDLKRDTATSWKGYASNPDDGKTYPGTVTLEGGKLLTKECILGGRICRTETWTRVN